MSDLDASLDVVTWMESLRGLPAKKFPPGLAWFNDDLATESANIGAKEVADMCDDGIEPSLHHATAGLYIKNFIRHLKDDVLKDYVAEVATPKGTKSMMRPQVYFTWIKSAPMR